MPDPLTLSMAAFLTLASQCGEGIAPATLADLQAHESGFRIIAININGKNGGTVKHIKNKTQAIALAKTLYQRGVSFDAGVAQINSFNFKWLGLTPETVFDPCESIKAQSRLLRSYSKYNTGNEIAGFKNGYVGKVVAGQGAVREAMRDAMRMAENDAPMPLPPPAVPACGANVPEWDAGGSLRANALCERLKAKEREKEEENKEPKSPQPRKIIVKEYP